MDCWVNRWMKGLINVLMIEWMKTRMDGWMDRLMDVWMDV